MKLQAIILSLAVLVYITENVKTPSMEVNLPTTTCCKKMSCKEKMQHKKAEKPKQCDGNNCVNCPLLNTFTFPALYAAFFFNTGRNNYYFIKTNTVTGVRWQVWQPPDFSLI